MSKSSIDINAPWPRGFDEHRAQQIVRIARETTPKQRLAWVEDMLEFMRRTGRPYHERKVFFSGSWEPEEDIQRERCPSSQARR